MCGVLNSFAGAFVITPDPATDLTVWADAIRASTAGNLEVIGADGVTVTLPFTAGETQHIRVKRVNSGAGTIVGYRY